jgi:hypothetical protein
MTQQFTQDELLEQRANFVDAVSALQARVEFDLYEGAFDGDPNAKAQAEALVADAKQFHNELLSAWPEVTTPQPHSGSAKLTLNGTGHSQKYDASQTGIREGNCGD